MSSCSAHRPACVIGRAQQARIKCTGSTVRAVDSRECRQFTAETSMAALPSAGTPECGLFFACGLHSALSHRHSVAQLTLFGCTMIRRLWEARDQSGGEHPLIGWHDVFRVLVNDSLTEGVEGIWAWRSGGDYCSQLQPSEPCEDRIEKEVRAEAPLHTEVQPSNSPARCKHAAINRWLNLKKEKDGKTKAALRLDLAGTHGHMSH